MGRRRGRGAAREPHLLAVVNVLDDAGGDACGVVGRVLLGVVVLESVLHQIDEGDLVLEARDVVGAVVVLQLQRLVELVVEALEVREERALREKRGEAEAEAQRRGRGERGAAGGRRRGRGGAGRGGRAPSSG